MNKKLLEMKIENVLKNIYERNPVRLRKNTPKILVDSGIKALPMYENPSHIRKNILTELEAKKLGIITNSKDHYHGLEINDFIKSIDSLEKPLVIFKSNNKNEYLILTLIKDSNGNNIVVPIEIETTTVVNKVKIDINRIKSVYGYKKLNNIDLSDYIKYNIKNHKFIKIYDQKKERGTGFSTAASSSITNITQTNKNIKCNNIIYDVTLDKDDYFVSEYNVIYKFINRKIYIY